MEERKIKFRAWDNKRKIMIYNKPIVRQGSCGRLVYCDMETIAIGMNGDIYLLDECGNWEHPEDVNEKYDIMPSIGIQDDNGKEIYQKDIVHIEYENDGDIVNMTIVVDGKNNADIYEILFARKMGGCVTIVGNIFETPNLLINT